MHTFLFVAYAGVPAPSVQPKQLCQTNLLIFLWTLCLLGWVRHSQLSSISITVEL